MTSDENDHLNVECVEQHESVPIATEAEGMLDDQARPCALVLRHRDQAVIAGLTFAALLSLAAWWTNNRLSGWQCVELDAARHRSASFTVDINSALWPEIAQLPGVGETLARRVVDSRDHDGPFAQSSDLRRVRGLGKITLERIKPYLKPLDAPGETTSR